MHATEIKIKHAVQLYSHANIILNESIDFI